MRLLLVSDCCYPSTKSSAKLMHDLAAEFARQGHDVTLLAISNDPPMPTEILAMEGYRLFRVCAGRTKGAGKVTRAVNEILFPSIVWRAAGAWLRAYPHDMIIYYSPSIFFGPLVAKLKRLWKVPSYLILRDIFPDWAREAGVLSGGPAYRFFKWREQVNYDAADVVAVQSPANLAAFARYNPHRRDRMEVLFNWTDTALPPHGNHRQRLGLDGKIVFFYGGNIGVAQDMDNLLRLAVSLGDEPRAYFLLVGSGTEAARLARAAETEGLRNFRVMQACGQQEYLEMLQEFDIGLITLDRRLQSANVPGKLLGYLQCGMPTLASVNPGNDLADILRESGAGLVSINGEDALLHANARRLVQDDALRAQMGAAARRLQARHFDVATAARQILSAFGHKA